MEDKELTVKEKALCTEKARIAHIIEVRNKLQAKYETERQNWIEKEKTYIDKINKLNTSIESGYSYIERTENSLKETI